MQTPTQSGSVAVKPINPADRRREPRRAASGKVQLRFFDSALGEVEAELLDVSDSGFRVRHSHGLLPLSAKLSFRHPEASGTARVVWNWLQPAHVETGFIIVR